MKHKQSYYAEDGTFWEKEFGYCHQNNARLIGYAANILAAVLGLVLLCLGRHVGLYVVEAIGVSFGFAWVAEGLHAEGRRGLFVSLGAVAATVAAYILALGA